jgi:SAM-dependent methyltransferase
MPELPADSNAEMLAHYRRRQSRLFRILRAPLPLVHNSQEKKLPPIEGLGLLIGGACAPRWHGFVTVDLDAYPGVDVAADVQALPFGDNSVAAIECDAVLEHVRNPVLAVEELVRVLKPDGHIHVVVPFNQPFHAYPSDFQRWTIPGLEELLTAARCDVVESGIRTGPTATMLAYFCEYCRIVAPASLGKVAYAAANWVVWPLRYLDRWLNRKPNAHILANCIYVLARKREA